MKRTTYAELKNYRRSLNEIDPQVVERVRDIIDTVRKGGDKALVDYGKRFDKVENENFQITVSEAEIEAAYASVQNSQKELFGFFLNAAANIREYHEKQKEESWFYQKNGSLYGQKISPLERVGIYVPGGKAFYPSSVLMNTIPAMVAGVPEIILATPPGPKGEIKNNLSVALAVELGVTKIIKAGGAQAIAALAYGTETIAPVSKITGPGNVYVAAAKRQVMGVVGIDSIAGPSEVITFADDSADPAWLAVDLCAQAEHDGENTAILISTSGKLIEAVELELSKLIPTLARREYVEKSLSQYSLAVQVETLEQGFDLVNRIAPEHIEVVLHMDRTRILDSIKNAGAIFLGKWTPVAAGDYYAGPNHVIPTNGTAVFSSPLGVYDFVKRSSFIALSEEYIQAKGNEIKAMAYSEELEAHGLSLEKRLR